MTTRLRPGGHGSAVRCAAGRGIVAEHYYALAARGASTRPIPTRSIFGDRLPIYYDPAAMRAEAPHVDAIAINYNVDSPEGWIAPYFFDGLRALDRRQAGADLGMVLCRASRTAPATATTAIS